MRCIVPTRNFTPFASSLFDNFWSDNWAVPSRERVETAWRPAVDIKETEENFLIRADVPGVDPKDIELTVENNVLTIKGERHSEHTSEEDGCHRTERFVGSFERKFTLPDTVDAEQISANGKNGVLEVRLPKRAASQPKRITIQ